ncbi:uncharacterized protein MYCGRDRAFT_96249 [Zymoseptoria tritici IPO323]|uniref:Atos-like conserved domain-containing protein n=2 Tax=Zymoseptoria tritici TaxID=1047171 RepID=F9XL67_ZYMTI|nr:uncharacterized protein MYCGRDRAFT_96249 [Zymoseptoria tritici IPO323]EGP84088.1 hypothetical protein MYCGRDRAFT_96249 [Zymoseptoria tritici IPO323]
MFNPYYTGRPRTPAGGGRANTIDRQEIIRRIKSRDSRPTSPEYERPMSDELSHKRKAPVPVPDETRTLDFRSKSPEGHQNNHIVGMEIERPRSALHRGDFRESIPAEASHDQFSSLDIEPPMPALSTSPVAPWRSEFPAAALRSGQPEQFRSLRQIPFSQQTRARATSTASSLGGSFVYKAPTSPLVQSSRPDTPEGPSRRQSRSPDKSRRHTFSPQSFPILSSSTTGYPASARVQGGFQPPTLRAERTFPYQAHQPRRSLNSAPSSSLPQTTLTGPRRPSFSDSPLHHAPMVGSYEESILRGRMSTTPSKPLDFVAQIGVLGKGDCKPSLRCPRHVSVPFPAVFYSYSSGPRHAPAGDQPSPYVGLVDLENTLSPPEEAQDRRRQRMHGKISREGSRASSQIRDDAPVPDVQARRRRRQKDIRRSGSPKAPPGGSYRIPQQGQLQIVIKNPNKTAVKLFLIPYDLSEMEPGQKTFIRQRSYSAGPIIDMPLTSRKNFGTDRPEAALSATGDPNDKPMLRYLIHIHICCPSKGRFYLYKSVRVVFANRVPDGKEKLRNEIQLPEPKYTAYKPGRESNIGMNSPSIISIRRRSVMETSNPAADLRDWRMASNPVLAHSGGASEYGNTHDVPMPTLPRHFSALATLESRPSSRQTSDGLGIDSDSQDARSPLASPVATMHPHFASPDFQESFRFGRDRSRERRNGGQNESLLSQRLMDLAFQQQRNEFEES